ncbi:MAG: hypothetical protein EYC69_13880 [Bacteroidetes bacterium]|nr:MAG: hypothetical protein EYC69_13880 [Bacteroidota bacterium]
MKKLFQRKNLFFNRAELILVIGFLCSSMPESLAQIPTDNDSEQVSYIDSLIKVIQKGPDDSSRTISNSIFITHIEELLHKPESFHQKIDSLKNVSIQLSPDEKVKLYTWALQSKNEGTYTFFGYLQYKTRTGEILTVTLQDSSKNISKPEAEKLRPDRWYGCAYYDIIQTKKSGKVYYTLLGWKAINDYSTQKLLDVLYFDKEQPKFGFPLFKTGRVFRNRVIFNFKAQITMTLRYEERKKIIVFDHLTNASNPLGPTDAGPDGTYDAFKFKSGRWFLLKDIDIRSTWKPKKNVPKPVEAPLLEREN